MTSRTILVTGSNKGIGLGIGLGIIQAIAVRSNSTTLILTSRSKTKAEEAIADLQAKGFTNPFYAVEIDITDDASIQAAVAEVEQKFGRLDVLINNAGIALRERASLLSDPSALRAAWSTNLETNVTSIRVATACFLPLLRQSASPRVINVSSARGSFSRALATKETTHPSPPYSTSKAALNFLTLLLSRQHPDVAFYAVSPGHCKTALNGFIGKKDPVDGGKAAAELAVAEEGTYTTGTFWEDEGSGMVEVGW
ncbi:uncharacterized protein LTR77_004750 [Saxophila tyrrhenica]|uniref:NAD(P)-binding protein n=1 Tax=Saxophila tyrrhenica TaxID=1690608 RepID=A0AAV9PD59_9PEZI|nr:hypothetical protein LTR77_004750 [Saxophila tyrrhenica]